MNSPTFRFAIISDPHITLPHTLWDSPQRFHLVEVSIPALEQILTVLEQEPLDFLLLPGDLTQHGERENHAWLVQRLQQLPFPAYVVPGNHDVITELGCDRTLSLKEFPVLYQDFGYNSHHRPYYCQELLPGVALIGLNSIAFDEAGQQLPVGYLDAAQLDWLRDTLAQLTDHWVMVMVHHNVLEHLPGQAAHPLGRRYILRNRQALIECLGTANVQLLLTGHLHVQDIAQGDGLWEITTGSLVSYPHPYRVVTVSLQGAHRQVQVETHRVSAVPDWSDLLGHSLRWMGDRSEPFIVRLLTCPPMNLSPTVATKIAPELRDFWAAIAAGDAYFDYGQLPMPLRAQLRAFGAVDAEGRHIPIDNHTTLTLDLHRTRRY